MLELTKLAILLETQKLEKLCIHYIENAVCVDNVLTLLISANELHLHQLKEYCIKFIVRDGPYQQVAYSGVCVIASRVSHEIRLLIGEN